MEIARLVLDYIAAIAWPFVALTAILIFRTRLDDFARRLVSIEAPGGFKLSAEHLVDKAEKELEELSASLPENSPEAESAREVHESLQLALKALGRQRRCGAISADGTPCRNAVRKKGDRCHQHQGFFED